MVRGRRPRAVTVFDDAQSAKYGHKKFHKPVGIGVIPLGVSPEPKVIFKGNKPFAGTQSKPICINLSI